MSAGFSELGLPDLSAYDGAFILRGIQERHSRQLASLGIATKALEKIQDAEGPKPTSLDACKTIVFRSNQKGNTVGGVILRAQLPEAPVDQQLAEFYIAAYREQQSGLYTYKPFSFEDVEAIQSMVADLERHKGAGELPGIDSMLTHIIEPQL